METLFWFLMLKTIARKIDANIFYFLFFIFSKKIDANRILGFAGWLTFFWIVWQGLKKGVGIVKMLSVPALRIVTLSEPREFKQRHY